MSLVSFFFVLLFLQQLPVEGLVWSFLIISLGTTKSVGFSDGKSIKDISLMIVKPIQGMGLVVG